MEFHFEQLQDQKQSQILSQKLQRSLKVLELSNSELSKYIMDAYDENPFIEIECNKFHDISESLHERYKSNKNNDLNTNGDTFDFIKKDETFCEYLMNQIRFISMTDEERRVCELIIYSLDSRGYLADDIIELADDLNIDYELMKKCHEKIKTLDPPGVAAVDLVDCLIIQLKRQNKLTDKYSKLIFDFLPEVASGKFSILQKSLSVTRDELNEMIINIKKLEPVPSGGFCTDFHDYSIIPEAIIEVNSGKLNIIWINKKLPKIKITYSETEISKMSDMTASKNESDYLYKEYNNAKELVKCIEMRELTVTALIRKICEIQEDFILHKERYVKPYLMKDIAQQLGVHESTISRAVKGKYIECNGRVIAIKEFFQTSASNSSGEVSKVVLIDLIKELIDSEDKRNPMSDQKLTEILCEKGFCIKRRTVTKYRESIGYSGSSQRKFYNS